jgi:hypothetical protein
MSTLTSQDDECAVVVALNPWMEQIQNDTAVKALFLNE